MEILHSLNITPAEFWVQVIGFLLLIWILNYILVKPINRVLEQRQADIKQTYDQLDADRDSMEKTRREYEQRLADIENHARERIQEAVKEAQELRASIIAEARKQAETTIENGRAELERERAKTFIELRGQVADLAIQAAEKVIGESMDDARQRNLVDQFIANVGATPLASANGTHANGSGAQGGSA